MTQRTIILFLLCLIALPLAARQTPLKGTPPARLLALAKEEGRIRVIVGVRDDAWRSEAKMLPGEAAIQRKRGKAKVAALLAAHPKVAMVPGWQFESFPGFVAVVDREALRALLDDDDVVAVEEDLEGGVALNYSVELIGAKDVHQATVPYKGNGQIVVVIDNGVDAGHPFLGNRVLSDAGACFSAEQISGINDPSGPATSVCPNGQQRQIAPGAGAPCQVSPLSSETNPCHHGTWVAGVIAGDQVASGDFQTTMTGVAPAAQIIPIQVATLKSTGVTNFKSSVILALDYVATTLADDYPSQIAAVNLSLAFNPVLSGSATCDSQHSMMYTYVQNVVDQGIAVVAATGNGGSSSAIQLPACLSNVIAVAASTDADQVASYSDVSADVELFAPGGASGLGLGITTSQNRACTGCTRYYETYGTSLAAPHVAGAFAVLRDKFETASVATLLGYLTSSPETVTDTRAGTPGITKPRIQLDHAIEQEPPAPPTAFAANALTTTSVRLTWTEPASVPTGTKYVIRARTEHNGTLTQVAEVTAPAALYDHTSATSGTVYQYEITTKAPTGVESSAVKDYAVTRTFTDDPIQAGSTVVRGIHIGELREAADAWRDFAPGLSDAFTSAQYTGPTGTILAADLNGVVSALNDARTAIGLPAFAYVSVATPAAGVVIDKRHVEQLRTSMR